MWERHLRALCEDFDRHLPGDSTNDDEISAEQRASAHISELLAMHGKKLSDFNLPELNKRVLMQCWCKEDEYDLVYEQERADNAIALFNHEQKSFFDEFMKVYQGYKNDINCRAKQNIFSINAVARYRENISLHGNNAHIMRFG